MNNILCYHHANCLDGLGAAWVVNEYYDGKVDFIPADYKDKFIKLPDRIYDRIFIVDFSFDFYTLVQLSTYCNKLTLIDHHKTAIDNLRGHTVMPEHIEIILDTYRSGCALTWEYFHKVQPMPVALLWIEDRDLWLWKRPKTAAFCAWAYNQPMTVDTINRAVYGCIDTIISTGSTILDVEAAQRAKLLGDTFVLHILDTPHIAVSAPAFMASEMAQTLLANYKEHQFAAVVTMLHPEQYKISLRCTEGHVVEPIAKALGGGGHPKAAGFHTNTLLPFIQP